MKGFMITGDILRDNIVEDQLVLGLLMRTLDPGFVETAGYAGFDFAILDQEHGPINWETLNGLIRAAEVSRLASIVRIPHANGDLVSKPLDLGATGLQLANARNAEEVRKFVDLAKFSPAGHRGVCRFVRAAQYSAKERSTYFSEANKVFLIVQIEGQEGMDNLDAILAVEGVDAIFIGPYDLSQALGKIGQIDAPEVTTAVERIIDKAKREGKIVGIFADTLSAATKWKQAGIRYLAYSIDMGLFYSMCRKIVESIT